jgi:hypothetical protein
VSQGKSALEREMKMRLKIRIHWSKESTTEFSRDKRVVDNSALNEANIITTPRTRSTPTTYNEHKGCQAIGEKRE